MFRNTHDDRGQLILAGAVVFSLVLIGIVVVFSTTLFTANMASSSATAGVLDGGALESDVEATVEDLIEAQNEDEEFEDVEEFEDEIEEVYGPILAERHAGSGPTIVSVSVECVRDDPTECLDLIDQLNDDIDSVDVKIVYETRSTTTERTITVEDPNS